MCAIKLKNQSEAKSFVWLYFGTLYARDSDKPYNEVHVYCMPSLQNNETQVLKPYKLNEATGNLAIHLRDVHEIVLTEPANAKSQKLITSIFSASPASSNLKKKESAKKRNQKTSYASINSYALSQFMSVIHVFTYKISVMEKEDKAIETKQVLKKKTKLSKIFLTN